MSTFTLKVIAIVSMLIDHIGAVFLSDNKYPELYLAARLIGRLAFPIFVFLIVEGFYHTKDIMKYLKRLGIFAIISEIPFDLAFYNGFFGTNLIDDVQRVFQNKMSFELLLQRLTYHQNVFFTLFLGLALIVLMDMAKKRLEKQVFMSNLSYALLTLGFCILAFILKTDYDAAGILLIVAFYLFRGSKVLLGLSIFIVMATCVSDYQMYQETGNILYIISNFATLAIIPIAFYNGKKGKNAKYIFYIFYPAHLLLLFIINNYL